MFCREHRRARWAGDVARVAADSHAAPRAGAGDGHGGVRGRLVVPLVLHFRDGDLEHVARARVVKAVHGTWSPSAHDGHVKQTVYTNPLPMFTGELCPRTRFSLAEILVLDGTADAGRMAQY